MTNEEIRQAVIDILSDISPDEDLDNLDDNALFRDPERYNKRAPLRRISQTDEIAQVAVFLCSDRASYMTGASVDVSGGMALH